MRRDIIIGLVVLFALFAGAYFLGRDKGNVVEPPSIEKTDEQIQDEISDRFKVNLPEDAEKITLREVSGGDASAVTTRSFKDGVFQMSVLADLEEPVEGYYEAWIVRGKEGEADYSLVSLGKLGVAKGGYIIDYSSKTDQLDHKRVVVSLEKNADNKIEEVVLEGAFK